MSEKSEAVAFKLQGDNIIQFSELVAAKSKKAGRPLTRSAVLRQIISEAHSRIIREQSAQ
jgi:hypothetical protein